VFLIPPIASAALFVILWWANLLRSPLRVGSCVVAGVLIQLLAPAFSPAWVAGLLVNVGTAVYLAIRMRLDW
jgi:hypothetical protein